ncbi:MAG: hypothetical protein K5764_03545 [Prevotella sp.]|nr:hypothetical protein [Prevotella sp.]
MKLPSALLSLLLVILAAGCLVSCQGESPLAVRNAAYYWRTDLRLDTTERQFLQHYHIEKLYCRYFDVVMRDGQPKPNATLSFSDTLPEGVELVPTVYIMEDVMRDEQQQAAGSPYGAALARLLVERILQMNETNGVGRVREIQIDCDYTHRSRKNYYEFLEAVGALLRQHGLQLSTTIRLHQLSMKAPPADYGVLMVYNTGDPRKFLERNPVLDYRDVYPYLKRLEGYSLPLAAAYPVYQWVRNIHGVRVEHTVEAREILRVKQAIEKERQELKRTIITYHLDKENINRYKPETYEEIYHH